MVGDFVKNINMLVDNISKDMVNYNNINSYSLNEIFNIIINKYDTGNIDEDRLLVKVISSISNYGYDIVSTHPFKLEKYK